MTADRYGHYSRAAMTAPSRQQPRKQVDALERSLTPAFFLSNLLAYPCSIHPRDRSRAFTCNGLLGRDRPVSSGLERLARLDWSGLTGLNWQGGGQEADHAKSSTKTWQDLLLANRGGKR